MAQRSVLAATAALALCFGFAAPAFGQVPAGGAGSKPPVAPPPGGKQVVPPSTGTDMEIDPDAKPPEPKKEEPPPLPPPDPDAWGTGGKDEEGKFAPQSKKKVEEDQDTGPVKLGPPGAVGVDMVVGFGAMRDVHDDQNPTKITAVSFVIGGKYRFGESFTLKLRFPVTTASIKGPQGAADAYNTNAIGNAEIGGQYAISLTRRLKLPIDLAIDLPTAAGDLFGGGASNVPVAQALVNQAAMFTRGWEENPLFAPKRFGFRVGGGVTYDKGALHVQGGTRLDLMGKTGGVASTSAALTIRTPTITWVTGGQLFYDFFDGKLSPGLRAWLAVATAPVYSASRDYGGAQFVVEPDVSGTFGLNADASLAIRGLIGFIVPIAGQLGGRIIAGRQMGSG